MDVETTISNKGNPFDQTNKLVCIGLGDKVYYEEDFEQFKLDFDSLSRTDCLLVGFNIKFDLHWIRTLGIRFDSIKIWDCQLAEFLLENQTTPYPSLNGAAEKYGFGTKIDNIKLNYWDKGIDTDQIPRDELTNYLLQDLYLTLQVYEKQRHLLKDKYKLFRLQCADLLVLEEMEFNGIIFDEDKSIAQANELDDEINTIYKEITQNYLGIPINLNSTDHVSCLLYGGTIHVDDRIPVGIYKSGQKVGQTRYKIVTREFELPRLVEPLEGTELAKEGYWSTDSKVLRSLKPNKEAKKLISLLQRHSELEKLAGTYFRGYPKLRKEMNWPKNMLHGTLNQCVARTGRLSSSKPNLQNADPETKKLMVSRYDIIETFS